MSTAKQQAVDELLAAGRVHSTAVVMFHTTVADHSGLTLAESKAMEIIERLGPLTHRDLVRESGLAPASVTALVDRLTAKKVARRAQHPSDRRRILIEIDDEYARRNEDLFTSFVTSVQQLCERYTTDQIRVVTRFLTAAAEIQHDAAQSLV